MLIKVVAPHIKALFSGQSKSDNMSYLLELPQFASDLVAELAHSSTEDSFCTCPSCRFQFILKDYPPERGKGQNHNCPKCGIWIVFEAFKA